MQVIKRNGRVEDYDAGKISAVIVKAGVTHREFVNAVAEHVYNQFDQYPEATVEEISDEVEKALMKFGLYDQAKNFIIYRNNHHKARVPKCLQHSESFAPEYMFCDEYADRQAIDWEWTHNENDPSPDISNLLCYGTPSEIHTVTVSSLAITHYEGLLGESYWGTRFQQIFSRKEFRNVGYVFARMELQVHAKVYRKFNDLLGLEVPGFYESWRQSGALSERINWIDSCIASKNDLFSLAVFSLLEGVSLFCIFAIYKNFQNPKRKIKLLPKFVSNINFSARDEILHSQFSAECYRTVVSESFLSEVDLKSLQDQIVQAACKLVEHEFQLIDEMIPNDDIEGITVDGLKSFVCSRVILCLHNLDIKDHDHLFSYGVDDISENFYKGVDRFIYNDNFAKGGREYSRKFSPDSFSIDWSSEND